MNRSTLIIIGFLFCLIGIFIAPLLYENSHYGEIFLLLIIYTIPAIVLATLYGFTLWFIELKIQNLVFKIGFSLIPTLILLMLALGNESFIQFIGTFGIIGVGITNLIWINELIKKASGQQRWQ